MKALFTLILFFFSQVLCSQNELSHNVYFNTAEYNIPLTEENRLSLFISTLDTIAIAKISIYGFCDDRGTNDYNLTLSQNRANTIKEIFTDNAIEDSLITNVDGKGEILLKVVKNENVENIRGLNRKVEIRVATIPKPKPIVANDTIIKNTKDTITVEREKTIYDIEDRNIKAGEKIRLKNIYFVSNYSKIQPESKQPLDEIVAILKKNNDIYFTIQGHVCCTKFSRDAIDKKTGKQNLSVARAKYIYNYFLKKGIEKKRMKYVGMRRKFPLGGDPKFDRRVEILITYIDERKTK